MHITRLTADDAPRYRELMLEGYVEAADAFTSTAEERLAQPTWRLDLGPGQLELLGRVDNLADRRVAGSVIVNEGNQRFFEPAAGRNFLASARWSQRF